MIQIPNVNVTLPSFWKQVVLQNVHADIKFRKYHWFWRYMPKMKNVVYTLNNTIWFYSDSDYNKLAEKCMLEPILGHEFMHLWQKQTYRVTWFGYNCPQSLALFTVPLSWLLLGPGMALFIGVIGLLPWYSKRRMDAELSAYKMQLLVSMVKLRSLGCPIDIVAKWHRNYVEDYLKLMFSSFYWCQWTVPLTRDVYREELNNFFEHVLQAMDQLAFVRKNSYLYPVGIEGIYRTVFNHYLQ